MTTRTLILTPHYDHIPHKRNTTFQFRIHDLPILVRPRPPGVKSEDSPENYIADLKRRMSSLTLSSFPPLSPLVPTIQRYSGHSCAICGSETVPGDEIFPHIIDGSTAIAWSHYQCRNPRQSYAVPDCRHWGRLGRCPMREKVSQG